MTNSTAMQATKTTTVKFPLDLHRAARIEAANRDMSFSDAAREGLQLWLEHNAPRCPYGCGTRTIPHPGSILASNNARYCTHCKKLIASALATETTAEETLAQVEA